MKKSLVILIIAVVMISFFAGCKNEPEAKEPAVSYDVLTAGTWIYGNTEGDDAEYISLTFNSDKSMSMTERKNRNTNDLSEGITFTIDGSTLIIKEAREGNEWKYRIEEKDGILTLTQEGDSTWLEYYDLKTITFDRYYKVSFNTDGGSRIFDQTVKSGDKATKPDNPTKDGNYLASWNDADGNKFDFANETVTEDITLKAEWKKTYTVGDEGPAGGIIFYDVDADNTEEDPDGKDNLESYECGWRYLESAKADLDGTYSWGTYGTYNTKFDIGEGKNNTEILKKAGINNFPAANACVNYNGGGYSDWYLPSLNETGEMYLNRDKIGGFSENSYLSSTENGNQNAASRDFSDGYNSQTDRTETLYVRPVRSF